MSYADGLSESDRAELAHRHITVTIGCEQYPGYMLGEDPEWWGWQRVRVMLPDGEGVVYVRPGEIMGRGEE